ncbi:MAG: hypothetical protein LBB24_00215, partial [Rickettsiales bacterium]|nr:hypothetical protein [Rickettsiales bacterium]
MSNGVSVNRSNGSGYSFGTRSEQMLATVAPELNLVARRVISLSPIDFAIVEGSRTLERQRELYNSGKSKTMQSRH